MLFIQDFKQLFLAQTQGKILWGEKLFFVVRKERPKGVPFRANKKRFSSQRFGKAAGNGSMKIV